MNINGIKSDIYGIDLICRQVEKRDRERLCLEESQFIRYWGRYLADIDEVWVDEKSAYYEKCYIQGCQIIAAEHQRNKEYEAAARFYRNILMINYYDEEVMQQLLVCYFRLGELKRMKQQYRDFADRFKRDMGIQTMISLEKVLVRRGD